jgi:F-type H+-transporting ATPase subunit epsilon
VANGHNKLEAEVLTPEGELFKGELTQLSTKTTVGEIGILANHVPMLASLVPSELRLHVDEGEVRRYAAAEGWLEVFANKALLMVGEATPPDELDTGSLRSRLEDAEQRLKEAEEGSAAHEEAERDRARAEAFLAIADSR